jgi:hypothetical protein
MPPAVHPISQQFPAHERGASIPVARTHWVWVHETLRRAHLPLGKANASGVFGPGREKAGTEDFERQSDELHAKVGQLIVEVDFLHKKSKQLGL